MADGVSMEKAGKILQAGDRQRRGVLVGYPICWKRGAEGRIGWASRKKSSRVASQRRADVGDMVVLIAM